MASLWNDTVVLLAGYVYFEVCYLPDYPNVLQEVRNRKCYLTFASAFMWVPTLVEYQGKQWEERRFFFLPIAIVEHEFYDWWQISMVRCPSASYDLIKESLLFSFFSFFLFLFLCFFKPMMKVFECSYICWTMVYSCPNLRFFIDFISFSALNCKICSALWAIASFHFFFWLIIPSSTWSHVETWTISCLMSYSNPYP